MSTKRVVGGAVILVSLLLTAFQVYTSTHGLMTALLQRSIHLSFVLILVFLYFPALKNPRVTLLIDVPLCLLAASSGAYLYVSFDDLVYRMGDANGWDISMGIACVLCLLEATRRAVGLPMTVLGAGSLLYALYGNLLPEPLGHSGRSLERVISQMYLTNEGIFGIPLGVAATYVFLFVLFGSLMEKSGVGTLFLNLALAFAGKYRGGPAKIGILSSAAVGTVSGSPVSDAATTGAFTIPLMVKMGYSKTLAAAVEASASSGASLMPPIMGASAFVMADVTGVPYNTIIMHAVIPALLFYAGLMFVIGNEARKADMHGLSADELPSKRDALLKSLRLLVPVGILIFSLAVLRVSPLRAALYSTAVLLGITLVYNIFSREHRVPLKTLFEALTETPRKILTVSVACATAGIIIGTLGLTGLGLRLADMVISLTGGSLPLALILSMIIAIILGMGLPPVGSYIVMAVTIVPSLIQLGVPLIVAHFFVFYYCCYAPITPPVALAAYTTSGIAGCDPYRAGLESMRISLSGFILPFIFVYGNSLLGIGAWHEILLSLLTGAMGIWIFSIALVGFFHERVHVFWRLLLAGAAFVLIIPGVWSDFFGGIVTLAFLFTNTTLLRNKAPAPIN